MHQITNPTIKLHTIPKDQGTHLNTLILDYRDNYFNLQGGTRDTIHVFTAGVAIYVLTINKALGYMALNSFMAPEPDPLNSLFLHSTKEIREYLGAKWESLKPESIVTKLIEYLY